MPVQITPRVPLQAASPASESPVRAVLADFLAGVVAAVPRVLSGLVFLAFAYLLIRLVRAVLRSVLDRVYADDQQLVVDLFVTVASLFLWFGALLALLKVVGMGDVAASLGTATGFVALGVAFALKEMIADTVAGVYLLRDPDFNEGDRVTTASVSGTVARIDLRKTRIRGDGGELTVVANRDVEQRWVQAADAADEGSTGSAEETP